MSISKLALAGGLLAVGALALRPANMRISAKATKDTSTALEPVGRPTSSEKVAAEARAFDQFLIEAAQTAREKAQGAELKDWVETLLATHRQSLKGLENLILKEAYWMPVNDIVPPYTGWLTQLRQTSLQDFDRAFLHHICEAHDRAQSVFASFVTRHPKGALSQHLTAGADSRQSHLDRLEALKALPDPVFAFTN